MLALLLLACAADLAPEAAGYTETTAVTSDGTELPVAIWYPALVPDEGELAVYEAGLSFEAWAEAPAATGPFQVVVFSHGNAGWGHNGARNWEALARAGYVVVAPNHVGNTWVDSPSAEEWLDVLLRRPDDLAAAVDAAVHLSSDDDSVLAGRVDASIIALAGHSTGGATALMAAGAGFDRTRAMLGCSAGQLAGEICDRAAASDEEMLTFRPAGLPPVAASVLLAPLDGGAFSSGSFDDVDGATLVAVGTRDEVTPADSHARPVHAGVPDPRALALFDGAGHYGFANICDVPGLADGAPSAAAECAPPYLSEDEIVAATVDLTLAWLDVHLAADPDATPLADAAAGHAVSLE